MSWNKTRIQKVGQKLLKESHWSLIEREMPQFVGHTQHVLKKKKEQIYTSSPTKIVVKPSATWPESMTIAASLQINQVNIENKI